MWRKLSVIHPVIVLLLAFGFYISSHLNLSPPAKVDIVISRNMVRGFENYERLIEDYELLKVNLKTYEKQKILLVYLEDRSQEPAFSWVSSGFVSVLHSVFLQSKQLVPVVVENKETAVRLLGHDFEGHVDLDTSIALANKRGCQLLVMGDYNRRGNRLIFNIILYDVTNRETVNNIDNIYAPSRADVFKTINKLSNRILETLNIEMREKAKLRALFTTNPRSFTLFQLALSELFQGFLYAAKHHMAEALVLDERFVMCYFYLAFIERKLAGQNSTYINYAFGNKDALPYVYGKFIEAEHHVYNQRYQDAISSLRAIVASGTARKYALYFLADLYYELGMYENAEESAQALLEIDPELIGAYKLKALSLLKRKHIDEALTTLSQILARRPNSPSLYYVIGYIYEVKEEYEFALSYYQQAVDLEPDFLMPNVKIIDILLYQRDASGVLAQLDKVAESQMADASLQRLFLEKKVCALYLKGDAAQALEALQQGKRSGLCAQGMAKYALVEAHLLVQQERHGEAMAALRGVQAELGGAQTLEIAGLYVHLLQELLSGQELLNALQQAKVYLPDFQTYIEAHVLIMQGRKRRALDTLEAVYAQESYSFILLHDLSRISLQSEDYIKSIFYGAQYLEMLAPELMKMPANLYLPQIYQVLHDAYCALDDKQTAQAYVLSVS